MTPDWLPDGAVRGMGFINSCCHGEERSKRAATRYREELSQSQCIHRRQDIAWMIDTQKSISRPWVSQKRYIGRWEIRSRASKSLQGMYAYTIEIYPNHLWIDESQTDIIA